MKPLLVVLAAGASTRLGTCKAAVDIGGLSPAKRLLSEAAPLAEESAPPLVVTGADHATIATHLAGLVDAGQCDLLHNTEWKHGRTGGVLAAARAHPGRDLCIAPVDVPLVPRSIFTSLASAWEKFGAPAAGWLAPFLVQTPAEGSREPARRYGHPVVLGRALLEELSDMSAETSLRILRERAQPLLDIEVHAAEILDDLDTPEDLATLRKRVMEV